MGAKISQTRVVLVDDHPLLRQGIARMIETEKGMVVCGEAENTSKAIEVIEKQKPDVVLLDVSLNGASGIELLKNLKVRFPKMLVLVLSMHDETIFAQRALRAGAAGYIMKHEAPEKILGALKKVLKGEIYLSEKLGARMLNQLVGGKPSTGSPVEELSDRELEVFGLIGRGFGTRPIAEKLHLSVKTVESHRAHIKDKLNLKSGNELVHHAIQWVQSESIG